MSRFIRKCVNIENALRIVQYCILDMMQLTTLDGQFKYLQNVAQQAYFRIEFVWKLSMKMDTNEFRVDLAEYNESKWWITFW